MTRKTLLAAVCIGAVVTGIYGVYRNVKKNPTDKSEKKLKSDFKKMMSEDKGNNILLGKIGGEEIGIAADSNLFNANVFVCGNTGTGKSYHHMLSNLLNGNSSAVIYDPYESVSAKVLEENGYEVIELTDDFFRQTLQAELEEIILKSRTQKTAFILNVSYFSRAVKVIFETLMKKTEGNHVTFWLDEICNADKIENLEKFIIFTRKSNVSFQLITQSFDAFEYKYSDSINALLPNIGTFLITGTPSHDNAEYFAEKIMGDKNYQLPEVKPSQNLVNVYGHVAVCEKLNPADYR